MELLSVFVDSHYEVRPVWRFSVYCAVAAVLFVAAGIALGSVVAWIYPDLFEATEGDIRLLGVVTVARIISSFGALIIVARFVDRVPIAVFGVGLHNRWLQEFGTGAALAGGMLGLTLAGSFLFGKVQIAWAGSAAAIPAIGLTFAILAVAAAHEEILFRGYPLQVLMKAIGPWGGVVLLSSVFGLLHARNLEATKLSVFNTIIAGVLLSLAYLKTRSLWFPYGIHIGWNLGLAVVLGVPMSGLRTASFLTTHVSGSQTILGGGYGPEDGVLGTVIFLAGAVAVYRMRSRVEES